MLESDELPEERVSVFRNWFEPVHEPLVRVMRMAFAAGCSREDVERDMAELIREAAEGFTRRGRPRRHYRRPSPRWISQAAAAGALSLDAEAWIARYAPPGLTRRAALQRYRRAREKGTLRAEIPAEFRPA